MDPNEQMMRGFLRQMYTIRAFEEKAEELYMQGRIHGTMHLSIGEEASAVGSIAALRADDFILSTHRGHGHCIAKGVDLKRMMAEFLGKATGYCRGLGGSMHIADTERGNLGANGVVGGGLPLSVGVGLSLNMQKRDQVVLCLFGDGAANTGAFHESLNMAAIWNLPVVYVCENNQYAMSFSVERAFKIAHIADRASSYGIPGATVDGNDLLAVYEAVSQSVERARRGEGPSIVENVTCRWRGHAKSDPQLYRPPGEIEQWKQRDPIRRFRDLMVAQGVLTDQEADEIRQQAYEAIQVALAFAEASPDPSIDDLEEGVYA